MGGGGRGMRVVRDEAQLAARLEEAQEKRSPHSATPLCSWKISSAAKHIEVQILADEHGNLLHLYERRLLRAAAAPEVVEVAPAANLPQNVREGLCAAAVQIARTANYRNACTVEFLYDVDSQNWYFIEVNPRVQVEHTVTEMVTGWTSCVRRY